MTYKIARERMYAEMPDCGVVSRHMATSTNPDTNAAGIRVAEHVTSRDNRWLKQFRAALAGEPARSSRARATRAPDGTEAPARDTVPALPHEPPASNDEIVGVEGARLVHAALQIASQSGLEIIAVLTSESGARHLPTLAAIIPPTARILTTTDFLFARVSGTETPQGIAALLRPYAATFDDLVRGTPLIVVMLGLQDPGNVGALVRTADVFGATGIAACAAGGTGTANPFGPKALRASAGSALRLPILRGVAAPVLLTQLRIAGVPVYATCPGDFRGQPASGVAAGASSRGVLAPWDVDWRAPAALLMGNEGAGLPAEILRSADALVRIPQATCGATCSADSAVDAAVDSLNVAVAGGILLYEAARQRGLA
jgi:RNA methyltransferase, TrmH family